MAHITRLKGVRSLVSRNEVARFFEEGYWRHPIFTYRMWRAENRKWGSGKEVWEYIGRNRKHAFLLVDNSADEEEMQTKGGAVAQGLCQGLGVQSHHKVLEVGCGVARIGRELAPFCGEWWGCDISSSMIRIGRQRTTHLENVHFEVLEHSSLDCFSTDTFDRVYCCVVFMHLDQEDIFGYVQEMYRVLKPGGLVLYDALNLNCEAGWQRFQWEIEHYRSKASRPIHHSRFATPQEMCRYAEKAGLALLYGLEPWAWVQVVATKYPADCVAEGERQSFAQRVRTQVDPGSLGDMFQVPNG
jgi:SAM-dependent methyltransferase